MARAVVEAAQKALRLKGAGHSAVQLEQALADYRRVTGCPNAD